jgi:pimeloyl-ACP methyl ester carboxylesterase
LLSLIPATLFSYDIHRKLKKVYRSTKMPFATVNSHRLHYVESSELGYDVDTSKATIVMVHGLGSSQNFYVPTFPALAGHRCIALSTYGAAQSKSNGEELTLEGLADDVIGLMDHLKIEKAILAGHSMGGPMVLTAAARHSQRVLGVVPIGPVNPSSVKPEIFTSRIETVLKGTNAHGIL